MKRAVFVGAFFCGFCNIRVSAKRLFYIIILLQCSTHIKTCNIRFRSCCCRTAVVFFCLNAIKCVKRFIAFKNIIFGLLLTRFILRSNHKRQPKNNTKQFTHHEIGLAFLTIGFFGKTKINLIQSKIIQFPRTIEIDL